MPGLISKPEVQLPEASHAGRDHSGNILNERRFKLLLTKAPLIRGSFSLFIQEFNAIIGIITLVER
jgi:hypothetical protein